MQRQRNPGSVAIPSLLPLPAQAWRGWGEERELRKREQGSRFAAHDGLARGFTPGLSSSYGGQEVGVSVKNWLEKSHLPAQYGCQKVARPERQRKPRVSDPKVTLPLLRARRAWRRETEC